MFGNNTKHNVAVFYKIWKYNEIQLTKNKMDLHNRKINSDREQLILSIRNRAARPGIKPETTESV